MKHRSMQGKSWPSPSISTCQWLSFLYWWARSFDFFISFHFGPQLQISVPWNLERVFLECLFEWLVDQIYPLEFLELWWTSLITPLFWTVSRYSCKSRNPSSSIDTTSIESWLGYSGDFYSLKKKTKTTILYAWVSWREEQPQRDEFLWVQNLQDLTLRTGRMLLLWHPWNNGARCRRRTFPLGLGHFKDHAAGHTESLSHLSNLLRSKPCGKLEVQIDGRLFGTLWRLFYSFRSLLWVACEYTRPLALDFLWRWHLYTSTQWNLYHGAVHLLREDWQLGSMKCVMRWVNLICYVPHGGAFHILVISLFSGSALAVHV